MPKPLPPAIAAALNPPPPPAHPYRFFEDVARHPFSPAHTDLSLRNAWWLMDAAFLSYCKPAEVHRIFDELLQAGVISFSGKLTTQCYVASTDDWIVLAFRGTQVDDFCSSVIDWSVDAQVLPLPDSHGDFVHGGFLNAIGEVWADVSAHVRGLQQARPRPFWITGHSLGAALATLAANLCADSPELGLVALHTYGSPRVGDRRFGRRITVPVHRFRNNDDLVTQVPVGFLYRHVGSLHFIDSNGYFRPNRTRTEELMFNMSSVNPSAGRSHRIGAQLRAEPLAAVPGLLADHAPINYAIRLWNCYEAERGGQP
jgi:hypothetical protein